jgi:hypothetical protein
VVESIDFLVDGRICLHSETNRKILIEETHHLLLLGTFFQLIQLEKYSRDLSSEN